MLRIRDLTVRYGDTVAVDDVDLHIRDNTTVAILGPSGCGKSTLLRAIAGLEPAASGRIELQGHDVTTWSPDRRGVGLMFQDNALFPHRDVAGNVAFGLRMQGLERPGIDVRVAEVLALVGLDGFERRPVSQLSGGEQQRVALARALAPRPRVLLLDEPLGSLDRALRDRLLVELPALFDRLDLTVVHVTHDQEEALTVADEVVVMRAGRIVQQGPPARLWNHPANPFVARFVGHDDLVDATIEDGRAQTALGTFDTADATNGRAVMLLTGALRWLPGRERPRPTESTLDATVLATRFAGDHVVMDVRTDQDVALHVPVWTGDAPPAGARVRLALDPAKTHVMPADRA
jgi:thiamine transport system ATP-binding protein